MGNNVGPPQSSDCDQEYVMCELSLQQDLPQLCEVFGEDVHSPIPCEGAIHGLENPHHSG